VRSRSRLASCLALLACMALTAPAEAPAKRNIPPRHNHGLTINAAPNPIDAGDPVFIYGQLNTLNHANRPITLWHHVSGTGPGYTVVQRTTTNAFGFYSFSRAAGVVTTNRSWFATAGNGVHSRTVFERVHALVSVDNPPSSALTNQRVLVTGKVTPNHRGERVRLQQQVGGNGDDWRTIDFGRIGPGSRYRIVHRFRMAGDRTLRVVFPGDGRNLRGESDSFSLEVAQNQNPRFTLNASADPITVGGSVTLTGTLAAPNNGHVPVTLYARPWNARGFSAVATVMTDGSGSYTFTQSPAHNTVYLVRTSAPADRRHTRQLFEGVHDTVTVTAAPTSVAVGQPVTFAGTVAPDKTGHVVELQKRGADGDWHTIQTGHVGSGSTYVLTYAFGAPGPKTVRVRVPGGPVNLGGVSSSVAITVSAASTGALPPAS
jgi:hypothetical protein